MEAARTLSIMDLSYSQARKKKWRAFTMHVIQKSAGIVSVKVRRLQLANPNLMAHTVSLVDPKFHVYVNGPRNYRNSASMLTPNKRETMKSGRRFSLTR